MFRVLGMYNFALGLRKSFLNQTTYLLKNRLYQQSFLNRDSFLNQAFLNRDSFLNQAFLNRDSTVLVCLNICPCLHMPISQFKKSIINLSVSKTTLFTQPPHA